ncbi:MAG: alpha-amylase family protein [Candidatus Symbiothrix sp.]|jgi:glycosidase|nr:alpha-amylase family protein [Candidatus Symbiothrix sp.]
MAETEKPIIYQILPRLFGNEKSVNAPNGDLIENGSGKLSAFTPAVLREIKNMGCTHIWYTGLLEHATRTDYSGYGIRNDHPAVVKGKAGSPYAIKDYYDIDPDLADNIPDRMQEFEALVERTHREGLKIIIDFVPNHVARQYGSDAKPENIDDLGEKDNIQSAFAIHNNFYYIPDQPLVLNFAHGTPDENPYSESPAKVTGNDCFTAYPGRNDWYETVKLNYGIDYLNGYSGHFDPIPDTWHKMYAILCFWASKNIDGFRCDMAEMVPVAFWAWVIPRVKQQFPGALFIAEVYNPSLYRDYLWIGKFDYLYDKVGLYDTLRNIICGHQSAKAITYCWQAVDAIQANMLNFLENHDEQRIASDFFAGDPEKALPALTVSACMHKNPLLIYAGQELGERGMDAEGFSGMDGRTSIFDYWSVASLRNWYNNGKPNTDLLTDSQKALRTFYTKVLTLCNKSHAIREGQFFDLMYVNPPGANFNPDKQFAFMRKAGNELLLIAVNFDERDVGVSVFLPASVFDYFEINKAVVTSAKDLLTGEKMSAKIAPDSFYPMRIKKYNAKIVKFFMKK